MAGRAPSWARACGVACAAALLSGACASSTVVVPELSEAERAVQVVAATPDSTKWLRDNCEFKVMEEFQGDLVLRKRAVQIGANVGAVLDESVRSVATKTHVGTSSFVRYSRTDWHSSKALLYACDPSQDELFLVSR